MWMYTLLPEILNMTLTASLVILCVLLARLLLKKAPKICSYALWAVVLFRLLCPVSFSAQVSLLGALDAPAPAAQQHTVEYISPTIVHDAYPAVDIPVTTIDNAINESLPQGMEQTVADPLEFPMAMATAVWLFGMGSLALYSLISLLFLRRRLAGAMHLRENIYLADHIDTPFVMGLLRPKIYLPSSLSQREQDYILLHERHHIRRGDHIWKLLGFIALCIHWFNPLVWLSFVLAGKDMEMSCDEAVLKKMGGDIRADYSASLLSLATGKRIVAGAPLAFGEGSTKDRIKNALKWQEAPAWLKILGAVCCGVVVILCAANPKEESLTAPEPFGHTYQVAEVVWTYPSYSAVLEPFPVSQCALSSDYALSVLEGDTWLYPGTFQSVRLTEENFDNLFTLLPISGAEYRKNNKNAWKCVVSEASSTGLFYLLEQTDGTILLAQGYTAGSTHSDQIKWVYRLERADYVTCKVQAKGSNTDLGALDWYADGSGLDWNSLRSVTVYGSASLAFTVEGSPETLIVSEDYYVNHSDEDGGHPAVKSTAYTLYPASDGVFYLPVERRNNDNEYAVYSISYGEGLYALRVDFPLQADTSLVSVEDVIAMFRRDDDTAIYEPYDAVVASDGAYGIIGVVEYLKDGTTWFSFLYEDGWGYPVGVGSAEAPATPAGGLTYVGDGKVTALMYDSSGNLYRQGMQHTRAGVTAYFTSSSEELAEPAIAHGVYVTGECLYTSPYSSTLPQDDTGSRYFVTENGLTITSGLSGTPTFYEVAWLWQDYPYEGTPPEIMQGPAVRWQPITDELAITSVNGQLFLIQGIPDLWSIHTLVPESASAEVPVGYYVTGEQIYKSLSGGVLYPDGDNGMSYHFTGQSLITMDRTTGESETYKVMWNWTAYPYEETPITPLIFLEEGVLWQEITDTLSLARIGGQLVVVDNSPALANVFTLVPETVGDGRIQALFDVIGSSPAASSSPGDYVNAHQVEYSQLLYYSDYTLRFIVERFLAGEGTDLQGQLMRIVLDDLAPESALRLHASTGQEYFAVWLEAAQAMLTQHGGAWMQENQPAAWYALEVAAAYGQSRLAPEDAFLASLPMEFEFLSGAGAWRTTLTLNADLTFTGRHSDTDAGHVYLCDFSGSFRDLVKIGSGPLAAYSLTLAHCTTERPEGEEWTKNGILYTAVGPYGIEGGETFTVYAPEMPPEAVPEEVLSWYPDRELLLDGSINTLRRWCLANDQTGDAFFSDPQ